MFLYLDSHRYFAVAGDGLEALVAGELARLGAADVEPTRRGVHFTAVAGVLARIVVGSRLAGRILAPLRSFSCRDDRELYRGVKALPWEEFMRVDETLAVSCTLIASELRHTQYAAQVTKDAVCDRFRERENQRPSVDRHEADVRIHVHVQGEEATVSLDAGAGARHRRGYRSSAGIAPLQETIAAAVLELAQYDGTIPLLDPMCGSGTLLAEAALRATGAPVITDSAGLGCARLPGVGAEIVERALEERIGAMTEEAEASIVGCEIDREVLAIALENLARVPGGEDVRLWRGDFRDHDGVRDGLVVCNPPYGLRMGSRDEAFDTVRALGDFLKRRCAGSMAWLVLGDTELVKHVGLRPAQRVPVHIGGLEGRLVRYELF